MSSNPILNELYGIRSQILAELGEDLRGYLHSELEHMKASGHPIAKIEQRSIRRSEVVKLDEAAAANQAGATVEW